MKKEYDLKKLKKVSKGPVVPKTTKVPVTIRLDIAIVEWAMGEAEKVGIGYQTYLNMKLLEIMRPPAAHKSKKRA